jgi:hypothetical protein
VRARCTIAVLLTLAGCSHTSSKDRSLQESKQRLSKFKFELSESDVGVPVKPSETGVLGFEALQMYRLERKVDINGDLRLKVLSPVSRSREVQRGAVLLSDSGRSRSLGAFDDADSCVFASEISETAAGSQSLRISVACPSH